jgi:2-keto-4-pentenoate hydratase/2-oxohepta-3-ene-1,7-dioic acid hydratase in catechol pathway
MVILMLISGRGRGLGMQLVSYLSDGQAHFGVVRDGAAISLNGHVGANDLKHLLAQDALAAAQGYASRASPSHSLSAVTFLPVIPNPDKVLCIGLNYEGHRVETNSPKSDHPQVFARFADSLAAHNGALLRPVKTSTAFDYEGELAVIIGKRARRIAEKDALSIVAGYSCFNDGSVRDWQKHTSQFIPGKNFPKTGALGPWLVTADEIPDPGNLMLKTRLNGETVQDDSTSNMLFSVQKAISYCSEFTELRPGDVIATGTPSGVGYRRQSPLFMKPGDAVEVEISGIGVLRSIVRDEVE